MTDQEKIDFRTKVRMMGTHLKKLTDDQIEMYLEDAEDEVAEHIPEASIPRALRYLVCHFATLNIRRANEEKISDMQRKFSSTKSLKDGGFDSTEYGQEYMRLAEKHKPKMPIRLVSRGSRG